MIPFTTRLTLTAIGEILLKNNRRTTIYVYGQGTELIYNEGRMMVLPGSTPFGTELGTTYENGIG